MSILESPVEALAFDYVSFGIFTVVNNLWPWFAVITAAVSFWRIRNAGAASCLVKIDQKPRIDRNQNVSQSAPGILASGSSESAMEPQASSPAPAVASSSPCGCDGDDDGMTKGKFALYYFEEESGNVGEITSVKEQEDECIDDGEEWLDSWERVTMRVRTEDMGWRRYQDLTVINGNVVRLWDDECRKRERYNSSCCTVW